MGKEAEELLEELDLSEKEQVFLKKCIKISLSKKNYLYFF